MITTMPPGVYENTISKPIYTHTLRYDSLKSKFYCVVCFLGVYHMLILILLIIASLQKHFPCFFFALNLRKSFVQSKRSGVLHIFGGENVSINLSFACRILIKAVCRSSKLYRSVFIYAAQSMVIILSVLQHYTIFCFFVRSFVCLWVLPYI